MIAARIRAHATRSPEKLAIDAGTRRLTYADLDARARAIAAYLRAKGVRRDDVVAIETDDRVAIVCGMAGAWYAGAAFVVVTSDLPATRVARMKSDANVRATIDASIIDGAPAGLVAIAEAGREDLAYVVFTSGTTGTPKGVLVPHAGLLPMLDAQIDAFAIDPESRCAWVLSPLFDASISDVGTALVSGATLVVDEELVRASPRERFARLEALGITHVDLPPSLLALQDGTLPSALRTIVMGGEACPEHVVRRVSSRVRLVNVYGPTEATVCTSLHVCDPRERHGARIGAPLPHVIYRVEDEELLIGGPCLARGYAGDPALTEERFVWRDGVRFYRTGDRVRPRGESAELEIVGRIDRQVKVAGVRIEPEEIEARLRDDPRVREAAVVPRGRTLHAFVATDADIDSVRARLAEAVPRWLVPARFVALPALPRTATGKVDLGALAARCEETATGANEDATVAILCDVLARALERDAFGADEDFIDAGGDSLAALAACAAADARGITLSPETITTERTPRRLASSGEIAGMTVAHIEADIEGLVRDVVTTSEPPRTVLLTGSTGTLGSRLVLELAKRGCAITCLVRARDDDEARARLVATLGDLPRAVRAVAGDVSLEGFGLGPARFRALAREHDGVVHAAADLRLTASYAALRDANVIGAAHVLDFAREGEPKRLLHVSTLSVFASSSLARSDRTFHEDDDLRDARVLHGGYAQSKWAAEALVRRSAPGASVIRLGLLLPSRKRDLFGAFVRAAATLGRLPDDASLAFDVTPVDFASRAIAHLVMAPASRTTFHLANRAAATLDDLARALRACGVSIERVSTEAFRRHADEERDSLDALALASIRALDGRDASRPFDLFEATRVDLGASRLLEELAGLGIDCPGAGDALEACVRDAIARGAR